MFASVINSRFGVFLWVIVLAVYLTFLSSCFYPSCLCFFSESPFMSHVLIFSFIFRCQTNKTPHVLNQAL